MAWMNVANFDEDGAQLAADDYRKAGMGDFLTPEALVRGEDYSRRRHDGTLRGYVADVGNKIQQNPVLALLLLVAGVKYGPKVLRKLKHRR